MPSDPLTSRRPRGSKLDARLVAIKRLHPEVLAEIARIDARTGDARVVRLDDYRGEPAETFEQDVSEPAAEVTPSPRVPAPLLHGIARDGAELSASVLIWFKGERAQLEALGAKIRSIVGDTATATVALKDLDRLAEHPDVIYVELSRAMFPMLDQSVAEIGARSIRVRGAAATGAGTVIGIIDVDGLDIHHPDFFALRPEGPRSRIAWLWDQRDDSWITEPDRAPTPWGYGNEFQGADIDADAASGCPYSVVRARPSIPTAGANHGTHMTGIAAGNGRASDGRYVGVAPEAEIVFVTAADFSDAGKVCDALDYVVHRAGDRPCAINISLGNDVGPHDGSTVVERFIDNIVATPGRCVVVAAGNSTTKAWHTEGPLPDADAVALELVVPPRVAWGDSIEIWYPGDDRLDLTLIDPTNATRAQVNAPIAEDEAANADLLRMGRAHVLVTSRVLDARNGDNAIELAMQPDRVEGYLAAGVWRIELCRSPGWTPPARGGRYHAWIHGNTLMRWQRPTKSCTVTCPATTNGAIAVGSYNALEGGKVTHVSGRGPTRTGGMKPDLVAPGASIHAPLASNLPMPRPRYYERGAGTSQSAAHVTGLVALMLQRAEGRLDAAAIKEKLRTSAAQVGARRCWEPGYGWGRARAPRALGALAGEGITTRKTMEEAMSEQNQRSDVKSEQGTKSGASENGGRRAAKRDPRLQVDLGTYELFQGNTQVGELLVVADPGDPYNPLRRIEHWGLYRTYEAPSATNRAVTLDLRYATGQWSSEEDFREHLQGIEDVHYVVAVCEEKEP